MATDRATSDPAFWNKRFEDEHYAFGRDANPFVQSENRRFKKEERVIDLGAGDGRNALFLAKRGMKVTALDFAETGLKKVASWAKSEGVPMEIFHADLGEWEPEVTYDGALCTFVQLLPGEREHFFRAVQVALRPGAIFVAEFFRPEHLTLGSGCGPSSEDRLVSGQELREHFTGGDVIKMDRVVRLINEGPFLQGRAATVQMVFRRTNAALR